MKHEKTGQAQSGIEPRSLDCLSSMLTTTNHCPFVISKLVFNDNYTVT